MFASGPKGTTTHYDKSPRGTIADHFVAEVPGRDLEHAGHRVRPAGLNVGLPPLFVRRQHLTNGSPGWHLARRLE